MSNLLRCSKCEVYKPIFEFGIRKDASRGFEYHCKECRRLAGVKQRAISNGNILASKKWKEKNREHTRVMARKWQIENPGKVANAKRTYEVRKINATPQWANRKTIDLIYEQMCAWNDIWPDDPVHVDHIIPLAGKQVCGLHVEHNLQIIRAIDNIRKHNKYE